MESFITQEYFDLISEQEAKFILDHAEKQLKDSVDTNLTIVGRSTTILTVTIGIVITLFGFCVGRFQIDKTIDAFFLTAAFSAVYMFAISLVISQNIQPSKYYIPGAEPKDFFTRDVFNIKNADYRLTAIYVNEIQQIQIKITYNKNLNEKRWIVFNRSLYLTAFAPIACLLFYWLSIFLLWLF